VTADLPLFIVEMYTPGEIVETRRSFSAETVAGALRAAMGWISDGGHDATSVRIVDNIGTIMFDTPVAKLK
jgi:hypothetical protein